MCVGVDKSGDDDFAGAVDLGDLLAMLHDPGIAEGVFGGSDGDDLAAEAENGGIFADPEFFELRTAAWA
jgi:hypothetical protein